MTPDDEQTEFDRAWVHRNGAYLVVLGGIGLGVLVTTLHHFRIGTVIVALALLTGAAVRLSWSGAAAGLLTVRRRSIDAFVLVSLGVALLVLAKVVPGG